MLRGETTKRSELDPDRLAAKLQAHGVERLRGESDIWVVLDGSDLRKPHAEQMEYLQRVKALDGGLVNGYRTLNAIGLGTGGRRGLLYHRLFSSQAPGFVSEPEEVRAAIRAVGAALAPLVEAGAEVTQIVDAGFDDVAVWGEVWEQGHRLVCRLQHRDRWVEAAGGSLRRLHDLSGRPEVFWQCVRGRSGGCGRSVRARGADTPRAGRATRCEPTAPRSTPPPW